MAERKVTISMQAPSGFHTCSAETLTRMIEEHLPNSLDGLRRIINERASGVPEGDRSYTCKAETVAEALMILGDISPPDSGV